MALTFFIGILMIFPACIVSQVTLTESGGGMKKPGETLHLTCTVSGFSVTDDDYAVGLIRQFSGKILEWIAHIWGGSTGTYYNSALQSRVSISKNPSKSEVVFQLSGLKPEDTAVYYCVRRPGVAAAGFDYWGNGTPVLVTTATPTAPVVFPLSPCCQDLSTASEVSLGCLVTGYYPEPVTVQWNSGAISTGIRTFPAVLHSSSGHYTLSSQLTVPVSSWNTETFQCKVVHAPTSSSVDQTIERCVTHSPVPPDVRILHSSCGPSSSDATIELACIVSSFYPKEVTVEWLIGGKSGLLPSYTEPPRQDAVGYTFSTTSSANISQADWLEGTIYACKVTHPGSQTITRSRAKKCEDDSTGQCDGIYVYLKSPTPNDLYLNRDPKVSCVVGNLESEEGLKVTWSREKQVSLDPEPMSASEELNGTYTVVSTVPILTRDWDSEETFTCTVEYPGVPTPIVKKIFKRKGKVTTPSVFLFRPHREEVNFQQHSQLTLTCLIKNLNPKDVSVMWLKDNNALTEDNHTTTPVLKDSIEDSYFAYSKLSISRADWDRGSSFTCMVIHEGLAMKFTQRTVEKSQEMKQIITVLTENGYSDENEEELKHLWMTIFIFFILFLLSVCYSATVTLFKVKWLFSSMVNMKRQPTGPDYKNVLQRMI